MAERTLRIPEFHLPRKTPEQMAQQLALLLRERASRRKFLHALMLGIAFSTAARSIITPKERQIFQPDQSPSLAQSQAGISHMDDLKNAQEFSLSRDYVRREDPTQINHKRYFENYSRTLDWMSNSGDIAVSSIPDRLMPHVWTSDEGRTDGAYAQVDIVKVDDTTGQKALKIVLFVRSFDKVMVEDDYEEAAKQLFYETIILEQALKNPLEFATDAAYREELQREIKNIPFLLPPQKQFTY